MIFARSLTKSRPGKSGREAGVAPVGSWTLHRWTIKGRYRVHENIGCDELLATHLRSDARRIRDVSWSWWNAYIAAYRVVNDVVTVLRVLHGARRWPKNCNESLPSSVALLDENPAIAADGRPSAHLEGFVAQIGCGSRCWWASRWAALTDYAGRHSARWRLGRGRCRSGDILLAAHASVTLSRAARTRRRFLKRAMEFNPLRDRAPAPQLFYNLRSWPTPHPPPQARPPEPPPRPPPPFILSNSIIIYFGYMI